jgi:5-methylcytosine-specific restriction protein A
MVRSTKEWIGRTDDSVPPPYIRLRIFRTHDGICHVSGVKIRSGDPWECDHIVALCNGGQNRESNMAPVRVGPHREKTGADVALRVINDRVMKKSLGIKTTKGRPMPGSKASGIRKRMNGRVEKR